jgi:hypothetical protein
VAVAASVLTEDLLSLQLVFWPTIPKRITFPMSSWDPAKRALRRTWQWITFAMELS